MSRFTQLDDAILKWAEIISKEVADRRFYDVAEVTAYAKVKLLMAIKNCVMLEVNDLEEQRNGLAKAYVDNSIPYYQRKQIAGQLAEINPRKKELNRLLHTIQDYDEFQQLKNFVREKYGVEALKDFTDNYLDRSDFKVNKNKHKHK